MSNTPSNNNNNSYLKAIIAIVAIAALSLGYPQLVGKPLQPAIIELIIDLIPNLVASLLAFVALYYLFFRHGIVESQQNLHEDRGRIAELEEENKRISTVVTQIAQDVQNVIVFDNHRKIDWASVLDTSHSMDIAVCYWDSWVKSNWEHLIDFFKRGGHIRLIIPSTTLEAAVSSAHRNFPRYSRDRFIEKVNDTARFMYQALTESGSYVGSLEVYFLKGGLNYAAIRVDNKVIYLSFYEHSNKVRIGAPSILLPLDSSEYLREYWSEEFASLFEQSTKVDIHQHYSTNASQQRSST
jgi:hypothetical protein